MRRSFSPFLTYSLVAFAVAGSLFLLHASVAEDQHSHTGLRLHESVPTLIVGTLMGGAVGGIIAASLLLKFDFKVDDQIEEVDEQVGQLNRKVEDWDEKADKKLGELYNNFQEKITHSEITLSDKVDVSIQKINELQNSIDEFKKSAS